ncbi:eukaryotic rRNA processing [Dunaliella salina]|uniref:Eukaryotic rRNA processing n=1 Tax=Dunaliella salina TaxID=3046 RepID=A0ABQ7GWG0_DUNSA|nr:eukaryotic rRNA processing [Dunaliella salina]|eukprot:KAF5838951.1 eukaryotic rRNA processing [Dunaliella salina]
MGNKARKAADKAAMQQSSEEESEEVMGSDDEGVSEELGLQTLTASGKGGNRRPLREAIYDMDAMHEKLEDIGWADNVPWEETLALTHEDPYEVENVDDDMARELAFYNQALAAAQEAIRRFDASQTPWLRPPDYYAEMVKSDQHMAKVKEQLMFEQRSIEQAEERRKQREQKQYSKQVQAEKQKERNAAKKKQIESVTNMRKQREKSGFAGELDYDKEMSALERKGRQPKQQGKAKDRMQPGKSKALTNKPRAAKDAKYGFGGKKSLSKQNTADSAANMSSFRSQKRDGKGGGKGPKKGKPGGVKKPAMKRPGKAARAKKGKK